MITIKTAQEIELMRRAGQVVKNTLLELGEHVKHGISTAELNRIAEKTIRAQGATPSFLGYRGFPKSVCISIEQEVVHGIPNKHRILKEGEIVGIDVGAYLNGFHGDAARTFAVGKVSADRERLIRVTEECFFKAVESICPTSRVGDIGRIVQEHAEANGYGVVRELCGHGIGRNLHEEPDVFNFAREGRGARLCNGTTIAIEPMINMGTHEVRFLKDGWTVVTKDGLPSAHYENTIAIVDGKVEILTL